MKLRTWNLIVVLMGLTALVDVVTSTSLKNPWNYISQASVLIIWTIFLLAMMKVDTDA
jgi:hypothetical protein